MIRIYLRFYEELNDFLPPEKQKTQFEHLVKSRSSVKDVIESIGIPHSEVDLILVNNISVDFIYIVQNNDRISVYPVFESFNIADVTHLRPKPLRENKFILDVHLGRLAKYLRMLGFDSSYSNDFSKEEIINTSLQQRRTILTRDRNLLKRNEITHGLWIRSNNPVEQVKEVLDRFHLDKVVNEFTLCMECNYPLTMVDKEEISDNLPPRVREYQSNFYQCKLCNRIYWQGTHYNKMRKLITEILSNNSFSHKFS